MNTIDLIVCLVLVAAVWNGWRQGFIVQVCSLGALVAGIWLASRFGGEAGGWLRLDESVRTAGGFVVVLLAVVLLAAVAARIIRKLFRFAGFGLPDTLLGVAVSVLKYLLLLSVLFSAFDTLNADHSIVGPRTFASSKSYRPVMRFSELIFPFFEWVGDRVPDRQPQNA